MDSFSTSLSGGTMHWAKNFLGFLLHVDEQSTFSARIALNCAFLHIYETDQGEHHQQQPKDLGLCLHHVQHALDVLAAFHHFTGLPKSRSIISLIGSMLALLLCVCDFLKRSICYR